MTVSRGKGRPALHNQDRADTRQAKNSERQIQGKVITQANRPTYNRKKFSEILQGQRPRLLTDGSPHTGGTSFMQVLASLSGGTYIAI
jgi:hypothetical protein